MNATRTDGKPCIVLRTLCFSSSANIWLLVRLWGYLAQGTL